MSENLATWWTPSGWEERPEPEAYAKVWAEGPLSKSKDDRLEAAGYSVLDRESDFEESDLKLDVWSHRDGHVSVSIWGIDSAYSQFFVSKRWESAFFASKYIELRRDLAQVQQAAALNDLRRFFLSFIRHGHGDHTVDADGWQTLDERRTAQRLAERDRRWREEVDQASIPKPPH